MLPNKAVATILVFVFIIIFTNFLYLGLTNRIANSIDYNIPLAQSVLSGDVFTVPTGNPFLYFPGTSNILLSVFVLIGFPNLFGLFSWVCLFIACKKLGETFQLNQTLSFIFSMSICTTMSVIRTIGDQSIDKWLCTWFIVSMILLEKLRPNWKFAIFLGIALGLLVGTKYSGPFFFLPLLIIYGRKLWTFFNPLRLLLVISFFTLTGCFWYIRNFVLTGNPYFPANFLFFKGYQNYTQQDWMLWKIPFVYPEGILPLLNSFISEYMIWAFSGFIVIGYLIYAYRTKQTIDNNLKRVNQLMVLTGFVSLLLPITPPYKIEFFHIVSDMRYIYIFVVLLVLAVFLIAKKYKKISLLVTVALLNTLIVFTYIPYLPKFFIFCMIIFITYFFRGSFSKVLNK